MGEAGAGGSSLSAPKRTLLVLPAAAPKVCRITLVPGVQRRTHHHVMRLAHPTALRGSLEPHRHHPPPQFLVFTSSLSHLRIKNVRIKEPRMPQTLRLTDSGLKHP